MGLFARKPVFGVSAKVRFKPVSRATETSSKIEISLVTSLYMILSNQRITKALIRLRERAESQPRNAELKAGILYPPTGEWLQYQTISRWSLTTV